jgi:hypothetical protein
MGFGSYCYRLGVVIAMTGDGQDDVIAELFHRACVFDSPVGCAAWHLLSGAEVPSISRPVLDELLLAREKRCADGDARECTVIGLLHLAFRDPGEGRRYLEKGCAAGDAWSCDKALPAAGNGSQPPLTKDVQTQ